MMSVAEALAYIVPVRVTKYLTFSQRTLVKQLLPYYLRYRSLSIKHPDPSTCYYLRKLSCRDDVLQQAVADSLSGER